MTTVTRALRILDAAKKMLADKTGKADPVELSVYLAIELAKSRAFGFMRDKPFEPTREMKLDDKGPVI